MILGKFEYGLFDKKLDYLDLSSNLDNLNVAIVTEGLLDVKIEKSGAEFVQEYMGNQETVRVCCFESTLVGGRVVTAELPGMVLPLQDLVSYIKKRKEFLAQFESPSTEPLKDKKDAMFALEDGQEIHVGRIALYATDFDILANKEIKNAFDAGSELMSSMLPCGKDCLMQGVSSRFISILLFVFNYLTVFPSCLKRTARLLALWLMLDCQTHSLSSIKMAEGL